MEWMQEVKGYSDSREEEEEEEAAEIVAGTVTGDESSRLHSHEQQQDAAWNWNPINHRRQLELTLGSSNRPERELEEEGLSLLQRRQGSGSGPNTRKDDEEEEEEEVVVAEKEHMFDKAVTPSDVGKLNRLVIPKQHAEKYFPLDSSSNEKGLLLNFEDRNGKLWRFRYSYWNSSQSYVMTKGWSRFVKEKKLDAGDIVSFHRGIGELYRHRLYIDWRPRSSHSHNIPHHPSNSLFMPAPANYFLPSHYSTSARLYSLPSSANSPPYRGHFHHHLNCINNNNFYTLHQHQYHYPAHDQHLNSLYYLTSPTPTPPSTVDHHQHFAFPGQQQLQAERGGNFNVPMLIDSVPVAHHHHRGGSGTLVITSSAAAAAGTSNNNNIITSTSSGGRRLRLFGVNMECASSSLEHVAMPNSHSLHRFREDPLSSSAARFGDPRERGGNSMLFDSDPSAHYRQ